METRPYNDQFISISDKIGADRVFTMKTVDLLREVFADSVKAVIPIVNFKSNTERIFIDGIKDADIYRMPKVVDPLFFHARDLKAGRGRIFTADEKENVVVVGHDFVSYNFQGKEPVGRKIWINNEAFEIIGVLEKEENEYSDTRNSIFLPYAFAKSRFYAGDIESIEVYAKDVRIMHDLQKNL